MIANSMPAVRLSQLEENGDQAVMIVTSSQVKETVISVEEEKFEAAKSVMVVEGPTLTTTTLPAEEQPDESKKPIWETEYNRKKPSVIVGCSTMVEMMIVRSMPVREAELNPFHVSTGQAPPTQTHPVITKP